jgi:hypothetical protein
MSLVIKCEIAPLRWIFDFVASLLAPSREERSASARKALGISAPRRTLGIFDPKKPRVYDNDKMVILESRVSS